MAAKVIAGVLIVVVLLLAFRVFQLASAQQQMADELGRQEASLKLLSGLATDLPREGDPAAVASRLKTLYPSSLVKQHADTIEIDAVLLTFSGGKLVRVATM